MAENIFSSFAVSGQGMSVQRQRLSAVANNIANANTTKGLDGKPYQREVIVVRGKHLSQFENEFNNQIEMVKTSGEHAPNAKMGGFGNNGNVVSAQLAKDSTPPRMVYDPSHPDANDEGYVEMPNINIVTEMVEMISAQRAFEANTSVVESAKTIARDSLEI
jgi:flagellar basal-body rod protein FlgC